MERSEAVRGTLPPVAAPAAAGPGMARIVGASVLGTVIEWYDFLIYGTASALVFNRLFFPTFDPAAGTLAAFASYAVGFLIRPLGGVVFGHFGDRVGRKAMLVTTMLLMGVGTFLIGCLPGYAAIGIWAPVLLVALRLMQGLGVGGEWSGAVLMAIEHAPPGRRGLYGSLVQIGFAVGVGGSTATFLVLSAALSGPAFLAWGWRLPFLASAVLIGVGLFIRLRLVETPAFARLRACDDIARVPAFDVIVRHPRSFLIAIGLKVSEVAWVYVLTVFSIVYATGRLGLPRGLILEAILWGAVLELATLPLFGWLSDRLGRRPLYLAGAAAGAVCAPAVFALLETRDPTIVVATIAIAMSLTHAMQFAVEAAFLPELFATRLRYTGSSLGCQIGAAVSGGFAPIVAAALLAWSGATWPIAAVMIALSAVTLLATLAATETAAADIARP